MPESAEHADPQVKPKYQANPNCPKCKGRGWLRHDVSREDADFGKLVMCPETGCMTDNYRQYRSGRGYLQQKGIARPQQTFATFKKRKGTEEAFAAVREFASGTSPPLLLIYGGTGNGKTHLCSAAAIELNASGVDCRYYVVADLMSQLKAGIAGNTVEDTIAFVRAVPALILDDFKPELATAFELEKVEQILNHRYSYQLPTLLISNSELQNLPERIVSRFSEPGTGKRVLNRGQDYRMR